MSKLEDFILNTDYGSLKNDDDGAVVITVPASDTIPGNGRKLYTQDIDVGSAFGLLSVMVKNNRSGPGETGGGANRSYAAGIQLTYFRTGSAEGNPAPYNVRAYAYHISQRKIRCVVEIQNPYSVNMLTSGQSDMYTIDIKTLLLPDM